MTWGFVLSPGQRTEEQTDQEMPGDPEPSPRGAAVLRPEMGDPEHHSALLEFVSFAALD